MIYHTTPSVEVSTSLKHSERVVVMLYSFWTDLSRRLPALFEEESRYPLKRKLDLPRAGPKVMDKNLRKTEPPTDQPLPYSLYLLSFLGYWPGSSVGIAIRYGLDEPGIEFRWGEIFFTLPDRPYVYRVSLPEVKRQGRGVDHPPHLAPRLMKGLEL